MAKRLAILNTVILGFLFGVFVWENTQPERVIVIEASETFHRTDRVGPGWPFPAYKMGVSNYREAGLAPEGLLHDPWAESHQKDRRMQWIFNGPVGVLLAIALIANFRWAALLLSGTSAARSACPRDIKDNNSAVESEVAT